MAGRLPRGRSTKKRSRGKRYLIVTNGKVTEKEYFERLVDLYGLRGRVVIDKGAAGRDPKTLVEWAADLKAKEDKEARRERFDSWESVWAVTDVDAFSMFAAQQLARQEAVGLAVSNPCFEVWLIDHMIVCPESCSETKACEKKAQELGVTCSRGKKSKSLEKSKAIGFPITKERVDKALQNAQVHNSDRKRQVRLHSVDQAGKYSVWTDVPSIVDCLRSSVQE